MLIVQGCTRSQSDRRVLVHKRGNDSCFLAAFEALRAGVRFLNQIGVSLFARFGFARSDYAVLTFKESICAFVSASSGASKLCAFLEIRLHGFSGFLQSLFCCFPEATVWILGGSTCFRLVHGPFRQFRVQRSRGSFQVKFIVRTPSDTYGWGSELPGANFRLSQVLAKWPVLKPWQVM